MTKGRLMTLAEVAAILNCSTKLVKNLIRDGQIPCIRLGREPKGRIDARQYMVQEGDVQAFIDRNKKMRVVIV